MKPKKLLSFAAAAVMAITSLGSAFSAFAADTTDPSDIVLPDSGAWTRTSITNSAKLEFSPYSGNGNAVSALSGKNEFYATFDVTGVPEGGVRAYLPTVFIGGGSHWNADDVVPFVEIPTDGTYTVKYTGEAIPDPAKLQYCGINCKGLTNTSDAKVGSITLKYVTLSDPSAVPVEVVKSYDVSANGDGSVTGTIYSDGTFRISGTGATKDYGVDGNKALGPWYSVDGIANRVTKVVVDEGVTSIGSYLLSSLKNATTATIPSTVKRIGNGAFSQSGYKDIKILGTSNITSLEKYAFYHCQSLETVDDGFLSNVTEIPEACFSDCTSLKPISIPNKITRIGDNAFDNCQALNTVTLPENLTYIGNHAFTDCPLTTLKIPDAVTYIGDMAFATVDIPASIESIEISDNSKLETIGEHAFQETKITSINLPEGLKTIGAYAFCRCPITSLELPSTLTDIGRCAFMYCGKITGDVVVPEGVTVLNDSAFSSCSNESMNLYIKGALTSVGKYSISYCGGKIYVYDQNTYDLINTSINNKTNYVQAEVILVKDELDYTALDAAIANGESVDTTKYTEATVKTLTDAIAAAKTVKETAKTQDEIDAAAKAITDAIAALEAAPVIGENDELLYFVTTELDDGTISLKYAVTAEDSNCTIVAKDGVLTVPETINGKTVTQVASLFNTATAKPLTKVVLPNTVTKITATMGLCSQVSATLEEIVLSENLTAIPGRAFQNLSNLKTITIPSNVTSIVSSAFRNLGNADTNLYMDAVITEESGASAFKNITGTIHVRSDKATYEFIKAAATSATVVFEGEEESGSKVVVNASKDFINQSNKFYLTLRVSGSDNNLITDDEWAKIKALAPNYTKFTYEVEVTGTVASPFTLVPRLDTKYTSDFDYWYIKADANRGGPFISKSGVTFESFQISEPGTYKLEVILPDGTRTSELSELLSIETVEYNTYTNNPDATVTFKSFTVESAAAVTPEIDYTALDKAIADAEAVDADAYTAESYAALTTALGTAKAVKENASATQDDVDAAAKAITDAINALEEKPVEDGLYAKVYFNGYNPTADKYIAIAEGTANAAMAGATQVKVTFDMGANCAYNQATTLNIAGTVAGTDVTAALKGTGWPANGVKGYEKTFELPAALAAGDAYALNAWTVNWEKCNSEDNFVFGIAKVEFLNADGTVLYTHTQVQGPTVEIPEIDYTALDAAIANGESVDTTKYTADTVKALTDAIAAAKAVKENTAATQDDVDAAAKAITDAINALKIAIDYTALDKAIADGEAVDTTAYTEATVKTLTDAITAAKAVKENTAATQNEIDAAAKAITDAIDALVSNVRVADWTEADKWYALAKDLLANHKDEYTEKGIHDIEFAIGKYDAYNRPDLSQAMVDWLANLMKINIEGAEKPDSNKALEDLKKTIEQAEAIDTSNYTEETVKALTDALEAAKAMDENSAYDDVLAADSALKNAINGLKTIPLDPFAYIYTYKKGATTSIASGKADDAMAGATQIRFTFDCASDVSYNQYASIEFKAVINGTESYNKYPGTNGYTTGATGLTETLDLTNPIAAGNTYRLEGYTYAWEDASDYVYAVTKVEFIDADGNVVKTITKPEEISLDELNKAIEKAEAIDTALYTDETVKALTDAIAAAKKVTTTSTEEEAQAAIDAINAAIEALELKPVVTTFKVTGTVVVSDNKADTEMTLVAEAADGTKVTTTATSMGEYVLEGLAAGEYTLTISGGKYVERTYAITVTDGDIAMEVNLNPLGDVNGDGKITTADVGMANSHAKGVMTLEGYAFACADVRTDGTISTADVGMINSHAKGVKTLW